jgi:hypothetical protein
MNQLDNNGSNDSYTIKISLSKDSSSEIIKNRFNILHQIIGDKDII